MSMEVPVSEGDEVRSLSQEEIDQRIHHAHAAEDDEPSRKRSRYESEDSSSKDEYVLISALTALMQKECGLHSLMVKSSCGQKERLSMM